MVLPSTKAGLQTTDTVISEHLTSIQAIEQRAGLDPLPTMEAVTKQRLEETVASELWPRN